MDVGQGATFVIAVVNVLALFGVVWQVRSARKVQQQSAARELYSEFLKFVAMKPESVRDEELDPGSQYDWSMYLWLTALESGWLAFGGNGEWRQRIKSCVQQNHAYFKWDYWLGKGKYVGRGAGQDFDARFLEAFRQAVAEEDARIASVSGTNNKVQAEGGVSHASGAN